MGQFVSRVSRVRICPRQPYNPHKTLSCRILPADHCRTLPSLAMSTMSQFVFPDDQPLVKLDAVTAFSHLSPSEQLYSHYLSQASWWGGLVVLLQTSPESPDIFRLIHKINCCQPVDELRTSLKECGLTEQEINA